MLYVSGWCVCGRPMHNSYSGVSKVDMSEDIEPVLSKIDVVLTFAIEVRICSVSLDVRVHAVALISRRSKCLTKKPTKQQRHLLTYNLCDR